MFDLNQEVAKAHQSVTETENVARQIEGRIRQIDGAGRLLPARKYGKPIDTAAIAKGLALRSLIASKNPHGVTCNYSTAESITFMYIYINKSFSLKRADIYTCGDYSWPSSIWPQ